MSTLHGKSFQRIICVCGLGAALAVSTSADGTNADWEYPLRQSGDINAWHMDTNAMSAAEVEQNKGSLKIVTEETGERVFVWENVAGGSGARILCWLPLETNLDLSAHGLLAFDEKHEGGRIDVVAMLHHDSYFPNDAQQHWRVVNQSVVPCGWRTVYIDLRFSEHVTRMPKLRNQLGFWLAGLPRQEDAPWRRIAMKNFRFMKRLIDLDYNLEHPDWSYEANGDLRYTHWIRVTNLDHKPHDVTLTLDMSHLTHAKAEVTPSAKRVWPDRDELFAVNLRLPASALTNLPPLYSEPVYLYAALDDMPGYRLPLFYSSSRGRDPWPLFITVPLERTRPFIMAGDDEFELILRDYQRFRETGDEARRQRAETYQAIVKAADAALTAVIDYPDMKVLRHGWGTGCPLCGRGLTMVSKRKFICKQCPKHNNQDYVVEYTVDKNWIYAGFCGLKLKTIQAQLVALSKAYRLTGRPEYARKAADILIELTRRSLTFPQGTMRGQNKDGSIYYNPRECGSPITANFLWEAFDARDFLGAYDLICDSEALLPEEKRFLIDYYVLPYGARNIKTPAALGNQCLVVQVPALYAGLLAGNYPMAGYVLHSYFGFDFAVDFCFDEDGYGVEKSWAYHWGAVTPVVEIAEALANLGYNIYDQRMKRIFMAPLAVSVSPVAIPFSEIAYKRFQDPIFRATNQTDIVPVSTLAATGYTTLRRTHAGDLKGIKINWGAPFDRGQNEILGFRLYAYKTDMMTEAGLFPYTAKECHSQYNALAHSALIVDGRNPLLMRGKTVSASVTNDYPFISVAADGLYSGVRRQRTHVIVEGGFLIVDRAVADKTRTYDWVFHGGGVKGGAEISLPFETEECRAPLGDRDGYKILSTYRTATTDNAWSADWRRPPLNLRQTMTGVKNTQVIIASHPYATLWPQVEENDFLIARYRCRELNVAGYLEPYQDKGQPELTALETLPDLPANVYGVRLCFSGRRVIVALNYNDHPVVLKRPQLREVVTIWNEKD